MTRAVKTGTVLALAFPLGLAAGCTAGPGIGAGEVTFDTAGGRVLVSNPAVPRARLDTVRARETAVIGKEDGAPEEMFGAISSLAVDDAGRVYVSDEMSEDVRVYGPAGEFLGTIGRRGDGPGEFRRPTGLTFDRGGTLYVRDEARVQRFTRSGDREPFRYAGAFEGPAYGYTQRSSRLGEGGRFFYPRQAGRIPNQRYFYLVLDSAGAVVDTLTVPESVQLPVETAVFRTGRSGGRMVPGLSRAPFTATASWDVTPRGTLLLAAGSPYEIVEITASGDTSRIIRRRTSPRQVPRSEYEDSARAVRERVAAAPAPLERLDGVAPEIRSGRLPQTLPEVLALHVGADGRIWVRRWPPEGFSGSAYDAFTPEGIYERTVTVPAHFAESPAPVFTATRVHGVVLDPGTGVQRVKVYELGSR
jgi:hypothetical protein